MKLFEIVTLALENGWTVSYVGCLTVCLKKGDENFSLHPKNGLLDGEIQLPVEGFRFYHGSIINFSLATREAVIHQIV